MRTDYNLETGLDTSSLDDVPEPFVQATVDSYYEEGLVGKLKVDILGKLSIGFDENCTNYRRGNWEIKMPVYVSGTFDDLLDKMRLITSGFNSAGQQALDMADQIAEILSLEATDATSDLNKLFSEPIDHTREFRTALGWQAANLHTPEGHYMRFFKPTKEDAWYDIDVLKDICRYWTIERVASRLQGRRPTMPEGVSNLKGLELLTPHLMRGQLGLVERITLGV